MKKGTFKIREYNYNQDSFKIVGVKGYISNDFGIYKDQVTINKYIITHLRTGFRVTQMYKMKCARDLVNRLETSVFEVDWNQGNFEMGMEESGELFKPNKNKVQQLIELVIKGQQ